jgi:hypothetical protein
MNNFLKPAPRGDRIRKLARSNLPKESDSIKDIRLSRAVPPSENIYGLKAFQH